MRRKPHVRFGGRAEETDQPKRWHRASVRSNHFMATELLQAGVALAVVSQRLDHHRTSTTLDYYAHAVPSGDRHAADVIRSIIDNARGSAGLRNAECQDDLTW